MPRIFVGNLPADVNERELMDKFQKYGTILGLHVTFPKDPSAFAFIDFEDSRDADYAVRDANGRQMLGVKLRVEMATEDSHAHPKEDLVAKTSRHCRFQGTQHRVLLTNLPVSLSAQGVKDFLREGGDVVYSEVDHRGRGLASFATFDQLFAN